MCVVAYCTIAYSSSSKVVVEGYDVLGQGPGHPKCLRLGVKAIGFLLRHWVWGGRSGHRGAVGGEHGPNLQLLCTPHQLRPDERTRHAALRRAASRQENERTSRINGVYQKGIYPAFAVFVFTFAFDR